MAKKNDESAEEVSLPTPLDLKFYREDLDTLVKKVNEIISYLSK